MSDKDLTRDEVVAFMKMRDMQPSHYKMGRHLLRCMDEREQLALAICGGEDAPGYANAQTADALEKVARQDAASHIAAIGRLQAAEAVNARLREAFGLLDKAAGEVARMGAVTGPQWTRLTVALLKGREALKGESHD